MVLVFMLNPPAPAMVLAAPTRASRNLGGGAKEDGGEEVIL